MTAFGGIFRGPKIEGSEEGDENGQRGRVVGLDLESGVVRLRAPRSESTDAEETAEPPGE
ncbi:hypothetical protein LQ327_01670 [Actinomycetospora endophytica]|uniref:Uncharacterized protein n=1 Tax=Actinomycetospora endophytica TaxID=2291215 RepID=A0ABS8P1H2_9PSEU|nr:hypothetical protein [Actinomycetospora endophytica]MCD2192100.1 hypothetical protein [Actinomycetospora endophytica]